jgi:hypothetical protein
MRLSWIRVVVFSWMLAAPLTAEAQDSDTLSPAGIRSSPGWLTVTTGRTRASQHQPPQVFAITARPTPGALIPFDVNRGLENLSADAAVLWVSTMGRAKGEPVFKHVSWPPRLVDFRLDRGWEGQPLPRIQQRLAEIAVRGWNLDVRVYFGTQHPGRQLLAAVQAELNRLTLPVR